MRGEPKEKSILEFSRLQLEVQAEREADMPMTIENPSSGRRQCCVPSKPTEPFLAPLKVVPHLRLKSSLPILSRHRECTAPTIPLSISVSNSLPPHPRTTVKGMSKDAMDDFHTPASCSRNRSCAPTSTCAST